MKFVPGLVSVSFRHMTPEAICAACAQAGLQAIEWGGDVHVPPGGSNARAVAAMTRDHGLAVSSYGSYFRLGQPLDALRANLDTALALGTDIVRIWAGQKGSADMDDAARGEAVAQLLQAAEMAKACGITLGLEYHGGTLTDSRASARRLLAETAEAADTVKFYWQPRWDWPEAERLASLEDVRERLSHIHAFTWRHANGGVTRLPLKEGAAMWQPVLASLPEGTNVLLEFFPDDSVDAMRQDAKTLQGWMEA